MSSKGGSPSDLGLVERVRAWWDDSPFLGDIAAAFAVVTVVNSVMMLTGLDEPKTGSFAYIHLLGRLGLITLIVGVFHVGDLGERVAARRQGARAGGRHDPSPSSSPPRRGRVLGFFLDRWLEGSARVYTLAVTSVCLVLLALAQVRPPAGGAELYRNLVVLAVLVLLLMLPATRWQRRRSRARDARSA
jgi:hypothetical protein